MFGSVLLFLVTVMHIYVFWRASSVPMVKGHLSGRLLAGLGVMLWLAFFLGHVVGHGGSGAVAGVLELVGMTWMVVLFLTGVSLFTIEIVTAFGILMPRLAPTLRGLALLTGAALSLVAQIQGLRPPEVCSYEVYIPGLPRVMDGKVLVAMSDLHLGSQYGKSWLEARVAQVQDQRPDLVVLLGDQFEGHSAPQKDLLPVLRGLSAPLGVWAVPGNHEFNESGKASLGLINDAGIHVLINRWNEIAPGLVLAGVEDLTAARRAGRNGDPIGQALAGRPRGAVILLSHTPWEYEKAAKAGVGLMLSGHTHGGQIWPYGYFLRLFYPLFEGRYQVSGMTVIVCRGTGTWGPRMRLWHTGEIVRATLHARKRT
jgi:uncharacterized protein